MPFGDFIFFVCVYMGLQKSYMHTAKYSNVSGMYDAESGNLQ